LGGLIAWGIVPTSTAIREQSSESLLERFTRVVDNLAQKANLDRRTILTQSLLTPSCGTGSLAEADAEMVFDLLRKLSGRVKKEFQL
jgi:cytochrome c-type biogenesis protein CcmH/NrfF